MADDSLFFYPNQTRKLYPLFSALSLARLHRSSLNFTSCSFPRESASVYATYLRSHFSVSQPKALRSRAGGYHSKLRRATCPEESHSSFCYPFSPTEFLAAASNLFPSTVIGPDKVAYSMLKHLPRSGMDFNLSWSSHSFPSTWKTSIIPIHKMRKPLDSLASFRPLSLTFCVSKLFERIILSRLLFFVESNFILSLRQAGFALTIWPFGPPTLSVPIAVEASQGALFRLERWSKYWCLPVNPSKQKSSLFSVDLHQANFQSNLLPLGSRLRFNPTPTFLWVTFDRTLSFSKHVSLLKAKFFSRLKALRCISASF